MTPRSQLVLLLLVIGALLMACSDDDTDDAGSASVADDVIDNSDAVAGSPTPAPTSPPTPTSEPTAEPDPDDEPAPTATPGTAPTATPQAAPTLLGGAPVPPLQLVPVAQLSQPVAMATRAGSDALWIVEKGGTVRRVGPDGEVATTPVLDLAGQVSTGNEQGLLGLAFSPDGERLYVDYTDRSGATNVVEYAMDGDVADPGTARTLLVVDQPAANHNAGALAFGPDGYLYVTFGDGGGGGDPFATAQDPSSLLGTILRIDPLSGGDDAPYAIPDDNPFVDGGGRPEVWLYGVRNPWRISFDRETDDLWIADVGQGEIEEVDVAYAAAGGGRGANLGWSLVEGTEPFNGSGPPANDYLPPIYQYTHAEGCSVTGGYVYRGTAIAALDGVYVFGDYCTAAVWGLLTTPEDGLIGRVDLGLQLEPGTLASFGEGPDGELYVLSIAGTLYRLQAG